MLSVLYPGLTDRSRGAAGGAGASGVTVARAGTEVPYAFTARTRTEYGTPPCNDPRLTYRTVASTRTGADHVVPSTE